MGETLARLAGCGLAALVSWQRKNHRGSWVHGERREAKAKVCGGSSPQTSVAKRESRECRSLGSTMDTELIAGEYVRRSGKEENAWASSAGPGRYAVTEACQVTDPC